MAWVRTAFSMISFGFTIGKFFQYLNEQEHLSRHPGEGRTLALALILLGLLSLVVGVWEYHRALEQLEVSSGVHHAPGAILLIAVLVAVLGLVACAGIFVHVDIFKH